MIEVWSQVSEFRTFIQINETYTEVNLATLELLEVDTVHIVDREQVSGE
jgi:hypothetical protein